MPREKFILKLLKKECQFLLIICIAVAAYFCQSVAAQSGRRPNRGVVVAPSPTPTVASEPATDSQPEKPDAKITSIMVLGADYDKYGILYYSTYLDTALKELVRNLKDHAKQSNLNVARGEKMNFEDAVKRAKKETDTYILWIGLKTASDAYGYSWVDYIDYVVLAPQTAKRLTLGRVQPGDNTVVGRGGGVLRLPTTRTRQRSATPQIISGTREIAERLIRWGWLD